MHVGTGTNTENNALVFNRGAKPSITGIQAAILAETSGMGSGECLTFMADQGYKFLDDVGTTEWVRIMNGNVGIGIAGPGEELSLLGKFSQKTSSGRRLVTEIKSGSFISDSGGSYTLELGNLWVIDNSHFRFWVVIYNAGLSYHVGQGEWAGFKRRGDGTTDSYSKIFWKSDPAKSYTADADSYTTSSAGHGTEINFGGLDVSTTFNWEIEWKYWR